MSTPRPSHGSEEIARVAGPAEAVVVRALLASYGIAVRLETPLALSLWPLEVRLTVAPEEAREARELLAPHRRAGLSVVGAVEP